MVFCHEWVQVTDGEMCAVQLSSDLKKSVGIPFLLFKASAAAWAVQDAPEYITDGSFLYRTADDALLMIWSSFDENGDITGNWKHKRELLFQNDGGHGMIFSYA